MAIDFIPYYKYPNKLKNVKKYNYICIIGIIDIPLTYQIN